MKIAGNLKGKEKKLKNRRSWREANKRMANLKQRSKKSCTYKLQLTTTNAKNETLPFHHQTDVRFWFNNIKLAT